MEVKQLEFEAPENRSRDRMEIIYRMLKGAQEGYITRTNLLRSMRFQPDAGSHYITELVSQGFMEIHEIEPGGRSRYYVRTTPKGQAWMASFKKPCQEMAPVLDGIWKRNRAIRRCR